jgi:beta-glucosidase
MKLLLCFFLFIAFSAAYGQEYKNPKNPAPKRVADLLSKMTLEEKTAQLQSMWALRPKLSDSLLDNSAKMDSLF